MKGSLNIGKISGIRIYIHWSFFFLLGWIFYTYFQASHNVHEAFMGVWFIILVFACVVFHELGHALMAHRFGVLTRKITLYPIGGVAQMENIPKNPHQEFWISIAGPLVNMVIALLIYLFIAVSSGTSSFSFTNQLDSGHFLLNLLIANVVLAVFNLIPAFPMDGGRILRAYLSMKFRRELATKYAARIGQVFAIGFVIMGIFYNIWLLIIGVFIYFSAAIEAEYEQKQADLSTFLVRDVLNYAFRQLHPHDSLKKAVNLLLDGQEREFLVIEGSQVKGFLNREDIFKGLKEYGDEGKIEDIMRKAILRLTPNTNLNIAYEQLVNAKMSIAPVYEEGDLLGIVDIENIEELLMVNSAIFQHKENQL